MSLNWNISKVKDHKKLCWVTAEHDAPEDGTKKGDRVMAPTTNALIWSSMIVELGSITEKNADEWRWRLNRLVEIGCAPYNRGDKPWVPTLDEIKAHVGLSTNVYPDKTRKQFEVKLRRMTASLVKSKATADEAKE